MKLYLKIGFSVKLSLSFVKLRMTPEEGVHFAKLNVTKSLFEISFN
jgi:hypothetical protein